MSEFMKRLGIALFVAMFWLVKDVAAAIPTRWDDPMFNGVADSGAVTIVGGGSLSGKSIAVDGPSASIQCNGAATISLVRVRSAEAVRIGGNGTVTISNCWLEAQGIPGDHADVIQAYSPGSRGTVTITNSTIRAYNQDATAGLFVADNYTGTIILENVIFWGGPFGIRIHPDTGGDNFISLKNVYFVGPYLYNRFLFSDAGGHVNHITKWENVRDATVVDGVLIPGALIPCPMSDCGAIAPAAPKNLRITH